MFGLLRDPARATSRIDVVDRLAPGLYAWVVTVALPCASHGAPLAARLFALLAVVALTSGALLVAMAPRTARVLGIWLFVGACVAVWGWHPVGISAARLDPVQGALGSLGWGLYALSWAGERSPPEPPRDAHAAPAARSLGALARTAVVGVTLSAALPMLLAWWVPGVERALFGHGVALAVAIGLVVVATRIVDFVSTPRRVDANSAASRLAPAVMTLLALSLLLLGGAALHLLR